ncbi:hypothetical protein Q8F55_006645 [Vanrija albida]|uniref:N-acetyltransferase domain-containing protein n=1 Tax=Vanrija albida TaxID=181172 RepID=A0ABR3PXQ2_9TREE
MTTTAAPTRAPTVQWDGDEPYLAITSHPGLRLTPYRDTPADVAGLIALGSHPAVGRWSHNRPYPFDPAAARQRLDTNVPAQAGAIAALRADPGARVATTPFTVIRDAGGHYVGDLVVRPTEPGGTWSAAYAVHPDFWGRGVGTAAVGAALDWARGVGAERFEITIQTDNKASSRLATKLGFTLARTEVVAWPAHNGGGEREVATWVREA